MSSTRQVSLIKKIYLINSNFKEYLNRLIILVPSLKIKYSIVNNNCQIIISSDEHIGVKYRINSLSNNTEEYEVNSVMTQCAEYKGQQCVDVIKQNIYSYFYFDQIYDILKEKIKFDRVSLVKDVCSMNVRVYEYRISLTYSDICVKFYLPYQPFFDLNNVEFIFGLPDSDGSGYTCYADKIKGITNLATTLTDYDEMIKNIKNLSCSEETTIVSHCESNNDNIKYLNYIVFPFATVIKQDYKKGSCMEVMRIYQKICSNVLKYIPDLKLELLRKGYDFELKISSNIKHCIISITGYDPKYLRNIANIKLYVNTKLTKKYLVAEEQNQITMFMRLVITHFKNPKDIIKQKICEQFETSRIVESDNLETSNYDFIIYLSNVTINVHIKNVMDFFNIDYEYKIINDYVYESALYLKDLIVKLDKLNEVCSHFNN